MFRKYNQDIKFGKLFLFWLGFFTIGVILMNVVTSFSPRFSEQEQEFVEGVCSVNRIIDILIAPFFETFLFIALPFWICKKLKVSVNKGVAVGIVLWILLHLLTRNIPYIFYISFTGFFYYRLVQVRKWKEIIIFHLIPNVLGVLGCLFG